MEDYLMDNDFETLIDRKTAAKYLGVTPETLAVWKCTKRYNLDCVKIGRTVRYRLSDLKKFIEERLTS